MCPRAVDRGWRGWGLLAGALVAASGCASSGPPISLVSLAESVEPLREAFNAHRGQVRFLAILSST